MEIVRKLEFIMRRMRISGDYDGWLVRLMLKFYLLGDQKIFNFFFQSKLLFPIFFRWKQFWNVFEIIIFNESLI